jgi:hypothetical protein
MIEKLLRAKVLADLEFCRAHLSGLPDSQVDSAQAVVDAVDATVAAGSVNWANLLQQLLPLILAIIQAFTGA